MTCDDALTEDINGVAPLKVLEKLLCELTFHFKEELWSLPDKLVFPTIPSFGALVRDSKHLATSIEDWERSWR